MNDTYMAELEKRIAQNWRAIGFCRCQKAVSDMLSDAGYHELSKKVLGLEIDDEERQ